MLLLFVVEDDGVAVVVVLLLLLDEEVLLVDDVVLDFLTVFAGDEEGLLDGRLCVVDGLGVEEELMEEVLF